MGARNTLFSSRERISRVYEAGRRGDPGGPFSKNLPNALGQRVSAVINLRSSDIRFHMAGTGGFPWPLDIEQKNLATTMVFGY